MQDFALNRRFWQAVWFKAQANLYVDAARTYLNIAWWVLEPVLFMVVYYLVFGVLLNMREPGYIAFLLVGLVGWQWFDKTVSAATVSIQEGALVLSKVPINRLFFPFAIVASDSAKTLLVIVVLLAFLLATGYSDAPQWGGLVLVLVTELLLVAAVAAWLALLTPFFPDLRVLVGVGLRALMFASGVFYPASLVPEDFRPYFFWNPMARLIDEYRNALLVGKAADTLALLSIAAVCLLLLVAAALFSHRFGDRYLKRAF